jgi:GalNAc-alpha-(1->4)-GalNAc-alpha-(1->3)-diNAcBac-PP-undecaprenol alpha-1,4-N-acetyl-D-galactosaminyltransferase
MSKQPRDRPTRILLFMHGLNGGGSERQMSYLASELAGGYETTLLTLASPSEGEYPVDGRVARIGMGLTTERGGLWRGLLANRRRVRELRKWGERLQPALVLSFCDTNNILASMALGRRFPVVVCERSDPRHQQLSRVWEYLRDRSYPLARAVVSQTDSVTDYLRQRLGSRSNRVRLETIPSAIRSPDMDGATLDGARRQSRPRRLLMVGRLSKEKRVDRMLDAWARVGAVRSEWRLRLVGDGPERGTLESQARALGIESQVEFAGWSSDVWSEYRAAHAYAITSQYEGFPQALIEAMASRLPVIAWDCSDAVQELLGGAAASEPGLARMVPAGWRVAEPPGLERAVASLVTDEALRLRMGEAAALRAGDYEWRSIAPRWLKLIESLLIEKS